MQDRLLVANISGKPMTLGEFNNSDHLPEVDIFVRREQLHLLLRQQAERVLSALTVRERKVLGLRFGLDDGIVRTFKQVGESMGFSETTARRAERSGLSKLRQPQT